MAVEQSPTGIDVDARGRDEPDARIRDLQAAIDGAERDNDYARTYRLQVELDALIEDLGASLGRGNVERARSAVTHRVRTTIRQLGKAHATLGRHLEKAIKTGTYCSYHPERPVTWIAIEDFTT